MRWRRCMSTNGTHLSPSHPTPLLTRRRPMSRLVVVGWDDTPTVVRTFRRHLSSTRLFFTFPTFSHSVLNSPLVPSFLHSFNHWFVVFLIAALFLLIVLFHLSVETVACSSGSTFLWFSSALKIIWKEEERWRLTAWQRLNMWAGREESNCRLHIFFLDPFSSFLLLCTGRRI